MIVSAGWISNSSDTSGVDKMNVSPATPFSCFHLNLSLLALSSSSKSKVRLLEINSVSIGWSFVSSMIFFVKSIRANSSFINETSFGTSLANENGNFKELETTTFILTTVLLLSSSVTVN